MSGFIGDFCNVFTLLCLRFFRSVSWEFLWDLFLFFWLFALSCTIVSATQGCSFRLRIVWYCAHGTVLRWEVFSRPGFLYQLSNVLRDLPCAPNVMSAKPSSVAMHQWLADHVMRRLVVFETTHLCVSV